MKLQRKSRFNEQICKKNKEYINRLDGATQCQTDVIYFYNKTFFC